MVTEGQAPSFLITLQVGTGTESYGVAFTNVLVPSPDAMSLALLQPFYQ